MDGGPVKGARAAKSVLLAALIWWGAAGWCRAGGAVSLQVTDGEVRDVLAALAVVGGVNIAADQTVRGTVTVRFAGVPFETALDTIVKLKGLYYQHIGDLIVVGGREEIGRNFGRMYMFPLKYARLRDAAAAAALTLGLDDAQNRRGREKNGAAAGKTGAARPALDQRRRLRSDEATNTLLLYGTPAEAAALDALLAKLDVPAKQVLLEARVVAVDKSASRNLGIEWEWSKAPRYPVGADDESRGRPAAAAARRADRRPPSDGGGAAGVVRFGRGPAGRPFEFYYAAKINALVLEGKASVLACPKVMTTNGKEAIINIGSEIPVPTTSTTNATTTTSITYKQSGIILKYTPRVSADGYITAAMHTEVSSPALVPELNAYRISKRSADTEIRLKDGETVVIGGLIGAEETRAARSIPFLSDLPLIGGLFRNNARARSESEVVIFVTAHIVK